MNVVAGDVRAELVPGSESATPAFVEQRRDGTTIQRFLRDEAGPLGLDDPALRRRLSAAEIVRCRRVLL